MALTPAETVRLARLVKVINKVKDRFDSRVDTDDDDLPMAARGGNADEVLTFFYYRELVRERNILLVKQQQP